MRGPLFALLAPVLVLAGCPGSLNDPGSFDAVGGIDGGGSSFAAAGAIVGIGGAIAGGGGRIEAAGGIAGGGGSIEAAGGIAGGAGSGGGCAQPIAFSTTCSVSGCHAATTRAGGLDLTSPNIAMRLSGKPAMGGPGLLIDPTNATASVLYTKLTTTPPFGARMPLVGAPFSDAGLACALSWIRTSTKGAP